MSAEQILIELKEKRLPTFGTVNERKERLRKNYGLEAANEPSLQNQKRSNCRDEIEKLK